MDIFKDKVSVVTGAGSGLGRALSKLLASYGSVVILLDINRESCDDAVSEIKSAGGTAYGEVLDVTDYDAFALQLENTCAKHGRIDYLFNNAGIVISGEIRDLEVEHWQKVIDVNLNGVFYGSLLAYKLMLQEGCGHIVNISSVEGMVPFPDNASYVASKHAVFGFTQALWLEARHFGINVSAVCPGVVHTPLLNTSPLLNADRAKSLAHYQPIFDAIGISPEACAKQVLIGVEKKKPIITITLFTRILWNISRLMPLQVLRWMEKDYNKWRHDIRLPD